MVLPQNSDWETSSRGEEVKLLRRGSFTNSIQRIGTAAISTLREGLGLGATDRTPSSRNSRGFPTSEKRAMEGLDALRPADS